MIVNHGFDFFRNYTCYVDNQEIPQNLDRITFQGKHQNGKENKDINTIYFERCSMPQMPSGISETFQNVIEILITESNLTTITKFDFKEFPRLNYLNLCNNPLEFLPGDLFEFNKELKKVNLERNKIKFIGPDLLDNIQLEIIKLYGNVNIDCYFGHNSSDSVSYDEVKRRIKEFCKPPLSDFEMLKKYGRNFRNEELHRQNEDPANFNGNSDKNVKASSSGLLTDLRKLTLNENFKDFTIKVGEKEFKVHKFLFIARSETFAELIKENPNSDELQLKDIPVEVFEQILNFIYKDEAPDGENIQLIFVAASKLKIQKLVEICAEKIISGIEVENLASLMRIFTLADKYEQAEMKLRAFEEIKKHFPDKKFKDELMEHGDKLRKIVSKKLSLDQEFAEFIE